MNLDAMCIKLKEAAARLMKRGLMQPGDSLSQQIAGLDQIILLVAGIDQIQISHLSAVQAEAQSGSQLCAHRIVYQNRKDTGAILISKQPWAIALNELGKSMPGIFDEQIRHLGTQVTLLKQLLITSLNCNFLKNGENAFVMQHQVICLGMTLDRVVFNAELLEKCAKAFVLATSTGKPVGKIPWLVRWVANGRLMKDERYAAQQYALGQVPVFKSAY